ncbi:MULTISPECIES: hypothetical protein [Cyanophyceae]|uniref:hypothetical protein n=1 Tax=Cyanophyceae TaxID=3028117 RepID=UPI0018EF879E|nr:MULTISPECIES: hypothetical protein [Cyanophyceae]
MEDTVLHLGKRFRKAGITVFGNRGNLVQTRVEKLNHGTDMISIPITLEQLITAVKQLQPNEQAEVAKVLVQVGLRSDLVALIQELYAQAPDDDITDGDVMAEIKAVRQQSRSIL